MIGPPHATYYSICIRVIEQHPDHIEMDGVNRECDATHYRQASAQNTSICQHIKSASLSDHFTFPHPHPLINHAYPEITTHDSYTGLLPKATLGWNWFCPKMIITWYVNSYNIKNTVHSFLFSPFSR